MTGFRIVFAVLLVGGSLQAATAQIVEPDVDRQGGDYHNFDLRGGPHACEQACSHDRQCAAWTFVRRGVQGPSQRCWLKNIVPPARPDGCCVSGIMR